MEAGSELSGRRRLGEGREAEIFEWDGGRVLRLMRDPAWRDRLDWEAAAIAAARQAGIPAPAVFEFVVVDDRPGLVMDRVDGTDLMTVLSRRPWRFAAMAAELARLQARLHDAVAPPELENLREMLRHRIDAARHLGRVARDHALAVLAGLPDGDRVCHGDFHPGNVIVGDHGPVVIDWTNAAGGDPTGDLARTVLLLRVAAMPAGASAFLRTVDRAGRQIFRRLWVRSYRRTRDVDTDQMTRWETVWAAARLAEGIDEEVPALLALFEERTQTR